MSVLIKGMEMPENCAECEWGKYVGNERAMCLRVSMTDDAAMMAEHRADFCPLTEINTPHGRLGDLDELEKQFKRAIGTYLPKDPTRHMSVADGGECRGWAQALMAVQCAKTVIKAEGENNA